MAKDEAHFGLPRIVIAQIENVFYSHREMYLLVDKINTLNVVFIAQCYLNTMP